MFRWFISVILLCILLFGSIFGFNIFKQKMIGEFMAKMPEPELPVEVQTVSSHSWKPSIAAIGYIEPYQGVDVTTAVAGLVDKVHFESGDVVKKDQVLVSLESSVENANLKASEARLMAAKNSWERNLRIYKQKLISAESIDSSESAYKVASAEVASLKAAIARLEIKAPFDGQIGIRQVQIGQYLQPSNVIAHLESREQMRVRFTVPQKLLPLLNLNMPVEAKLAAYPEDSFSGTINAIEPSVDKKSGVIPVQAKLPNPHQKLRSGMYATLSISQPEQSNVIVVPQRAINFTMYGEMVYVVTAQKNDKGENVQRVQQKAVSVGERRGDDAVILSGVQAGELLVTSGQVRLDNGSHVKIVTNSFVDQTSPIRKD